MSRSIGKTVLTGRPKIWLAILNVGLFPEISLDIAILALEGKGQEEKFHSD